jgi:hypothetical protein
MDDELEAVKGDLAAVAGRLDRLQAEAPTDEQARALELLDAAAGALGR